jgi:predicted transcriptional regulator/transcriptional regulator with XRE-family HTH domain
MFANMSKAFMGAHLKTLREQRGLTQAALAQALKVSPSYLNQIENNQRPLTVDVLLRLQAAFGIDLQQFSEDSQARQLGQLRSALADMPGGDQVPLAETRILAEQLPAATRVLLGLHKRIRAAEERLSVIAENTDSGHAAHAAPAPVQPYEEVREFFYAGHQHLALLDEQAEQLYLQLHPENTDPYAPHAAQLVAALEQRLRSLHGITVLRAAGSPAVEQPVRMLERASRQLRLGAGLSAGQQAFQLGIQLALLESGPTIDGFTNAANFGSDEARALARIGFANHFAAALLLPNRLFQTTADELRYDIDLLGERFGVGFETVGHRLSTMRHASPHSIPFFFVRVDRAGNMSKRQSSVDFHFSRTGGTCPLWNVYDAFSQPGKILTQLARMPDERTYLWIARTVEHRRGGYGTPGRIFSVALGCDARHAHRLVYADGLGLDAPERAVPIGSGCKVCDRENCVQRAFPALGRPLSIDPNARRFAPYAPAS